MKLSDFENNVKWPEPGEIEAVCIKYEKGRSKNKSTPYIELTWSWGDGFEFSDTLYITGKAISRLSIVASRVCGISKDLELPDDKDKAAIEIAKLICEKITGKRAILIIEEYSETFIPQEGPNIGKPQTIKKHRVAFSGYKTIENSLPQDDLPLPQDDLPF